MDYKSQMPYLPKHKTTAPGKMAEAGGGHLIFMHKVIYFFVSVFSRKLKIVKVGLSYLQVRIALTHKNKHI